MMMKLTLPLACAVLGLSATHAQAQTKFDFSVTGQRIGTDESSDLLTYSLKAAVRKDLWLIFRGTESKINTFRGNGFSIRHGGDEHEIMLQLNPKDYANLDLGLGVSATNTAERSGYAQVTYNVGYSSSWSDTTYRLGFRGVLTPSPLSLVSVGGTYKLGSVPLSLFGEIGVLITGNNTINTTNGNRQRLAVGKIGLEYCPNGKGTGYRYAISLTNQLGDSTGLSLSPALGGRYGVGVTVGYRF